MKKICNLLFICTIACACTSAQQFYFPKETVTDSIAFDKAMPGLAKKIIAQFNPGNDQKTYLRNLFMLQMVAKEYVNAIGSIHLLRTLYKGSEIKFPDLSAIQFEMFCNAKIKEVSGEISFNEDFKQSFYTVHDTLNDKAAQFISTAFITRNGVGELQQNLRGSLSNQLQKDSISIDDAITLCRNYNIYEVFKIIEPLAIPLLDEDDKKRYSIEDSVLIKTRDGAYISAIVIRKKGMVVPQFSILQFTIYARTGDLNRAKDAVANGYAGVMAYTRGKRYSPNEIVPYERDGKDVYDVIDWITKQPWSNGKVGMFGGSYNGFTTWAATKNLHPALKTIVPSASVAPGLDVPMTNNVFMSFTFPWTYYVSNNKFLDDEDYNNTDWNTLNTKWYASGKSYRTLDSVAGRVTNKIFRRWLDHPGYDKYWQDMIPYKNEFAKINIPVLTTTGYYDGGQIGAMYYFREHYKYNKNANHYLLIGPYGHFGSQSVPDPVYNGYPIDPVANISIHDVIYQWFDYILKDSAKPAILKDRINFEVMGSNEWKHVSSLDKMSNDTLKFYLSNIRSGTGYKLSEQKPLKNSFLSQQINFADRTTINSYYQANQIIYDSLSVNNGIYFVSAPVKKEMMINGAFLGELKANINKKDMDFSVTLYELMPDGKYFYLSYFMGRASYVWDKNKRQLLIPGQLQNIPFTNSYITSRKISKGSRIVIVLNVNKSPNEQINYGTGKDVSDESIEDAKTPLQIKWYNDSFIKVPVWK
ncbi:MAG: CocE/NonD family hydrolase [Parafilimonas sp.]